MNKLKAYNCRVADLHTEDLQAMFRLFSEYYIHVSFNQFYKDIQQKDRVFILKDKKNQIKGFSTLVLLQVEVQGKSVRVFFSGDTVVDRNYWGQGTLGKAFLWFLFLHKLRRPWQPLYWFLISKGYKTYLLMANNFKVHYPRYEQPTPPDMQALIDTLSETLYGSYYQRERGIISFRGQQQSVCKDALKQDVASITADLLQNPRIAFFQARNPGWMYGDELACIALMTLGMPFYYQWKRIKKRFQRKQEIIPFYCPESLKL